MRIHHLNCATMCPPAARLVSGEGCLFGAGRLVCHCLLVETKSGLALVDTGLGTRDIVDPKPRLGAQFVTVARPTLDVEETALAQVARLGFDTKDVRHVLPTHLDVDHAGGISDFPEATVHIYEKEHDAAFELLTYGERERYRSAHFAHDPKWKKWNVGGDKWFGFDSVRAVGEMEDEVLLVPLVGHTRGHCGVAVRAQEGWTLHAGDAYFFRDEVHADPPTCPMGLSIFQRLAEIDREARLENQARLRELAKAHGGEVRIYSAHCPREFASAAANVS